MRNMSFFYTQPQILNETKTVTRRLGWAFLKRGDLVMAVRKGQGIPKGGKVERLRVLRIVKKGFEDIEEITREDVVREGFPGMWRDDFIEMFCKMNNIWGWPFKPSITRIVFEYVERHFNTYTHKTKVAIRQAWAKWPETRHK